MSRFGFAYPQLFALYIVVCGMAAMYLYARRRRRIAAAAFGVTSQRVRYRGWKACLMLIAAALLVLAATRPQLRAQADFAASGRDIVFMLDVSRSMLAPDLQPSRLERARQAIFELLPSMGNARVGLVAFAGDAEVLCPLTNDMQYFRRALSQASPDAVAAPGTHLATSLQEAINDSFDDISGRARHLVLITDGEDHGRFSNAPALSARKMGVELVIAGVGDAVRGSRIPVGARFVSWQGHEVWSKLEPANLRALAVAAGGIYVDVGTDGRRFGELRAHLNRPLRPRAAEVAESSEELYRWPLAAAFLLLCAEALIPERVRP